MDERLTQIIEKAVELRRELHRFPEPLWSEEHTARIIRERLDSAKISWRECAKTGTVATLGMGARGPHLAFRGDMDGIALDELTGLPWASENSGFMHACGHDGHMAALIAAGEYMKVRESELPGPVSLIFQPAEEGGHGAREMIKEGALEGIDAIYGWHNWPVIPFGQAVCPDGTVMAANGTFKITITGRGGHASQPELCRDPVIGASAVTMALQQIVARRLAPQNAGVVSVTSIHAPSGDTSIPDTAVLGGSVRIDKTELREEVGRLIADIAKSTAQSYGVTAETEFLPRYGTVNNHKREAALFRGALEKVLGPGWKCEDTLLPIMGSEDFSYYLEEIPGAFALIGADDGSKEVYPCHNALYDFNDSLIEKVVLLFLSIAGLECTTKYVQNCDIKTDR